MTNWKYVKPIEGSSVLANLEKKLNIKFPQSYVDCVTQNNGGRPPQNKVSDKFTVRSLVRVDESSELNVAATLDMIKDRLPPKIIPFADDSFGNYFCFDFSTSNEPAIIFWDHEEKIENALSPVAESFEKFIEALQFVWKGVNQMKKFNVSAVLYPQENGGYTILSPELRGCVTEGKTIDEARENFKEAAVLMLKDMQDDNPLEGFDRTGRVYMEMEIEVEA